MYQVLYACFMCLLCVPAIFKTNIIYLLLFDVYNLNVCAYRNSKNPVAQ